MTPNSTFPAQVVTYIQRGLLVIVAVMPFHAFLSVWFGHLFGHSSVFQSWKELLLVMLTILALALAYKDPQRLSRLRQPWVYAAASFGVIALIVTLVRHPALTLTLFGLKTDLEFLLAAILATLVTTPAFTKQVITAVIAGAIGVCGFDVLQIFILPPDFLSYFGYGPHTIVAYQQIAAGSSALRFPATLGGPNQLGTYLILPACLATYFGIRRRNWWYFVLLIGCLISLTFTFSRGAWIGAAAAIALTAVLAAPAVWRKLSLGIAGVLALIVVLSIPLLLKAPGPLQYIILHASIANHSQANLSDSQHAISLRSGFESIIRAPFGRGLGTAGPSTFHEGIPNIIENFYLQVGYEIGLAGVVVFIALIALMLIKLKACIRTNELALPAIAAILGISIVAVVLPSWVDSSTSLIVWIAAGAVTGLEYV